MPPMISSFLLDFFGAYPTPDAPAALDVDSIPKFLLGFDILFNCFKVILFGTFKVTNEVVLNTRHAVRFITGPLCGTLTVGLTVITNRYAVAAHAGSTNIAPC